MINDIMTDKNVHIQNLEIWEEIYNMSALHSIRITLSNGIESRIIQSDYRRKNQQTLVLNDKVRKIELKEHRGTIAGLKFLDRQKNVISKYETDFGECYEQEIGEGENLIGVYGKIYSDNICSFIVSLGFITVSKK